MAVLSIEVDEQGVRQIRSRVRSISEANASAALSAKIAAGVDITSRLAVSGTLTAPTACRPQVYVNRGGEFEDLDLFVGSTVAEKLPSWMFAVVEAAHPDRAWSADLRRAETVAAILIAETRATNSADRWLDHYGTTVNDAGREVFVTEPYGLTSRALAAVTCFAQKYSLDFAITGVSSHHPSRTIRVALWPKD